MAITPSDVDITAGSGTEIDFTTVATAPNKYRQVISIGDPEFRDRYAAVSATLGLSVNVTASALPSGAATAANQSTANTTLGSILTGQATAANQATEITSLGTIAGAVKLEEGAHASGDAGFPTWAVRKDSAGPLAVDGRYHPFLVDANGNLRVAIISGAGSGGTAATDKGAFTASTTSGTPMMGAFDDTSPSTLAEGELGIGRMTLNRAMHVNLRAQDGTELTVGGAVQYDEDTPHVSGDKLNIMGAVRRDTASSGVDANGDRATINVDANGRLWGSVLIDTALPAGTNTIGGFNPVAVITGGYTPGSVLSAASTNATNVKASAAKLGFCQATNKAATPAYLKWYNKATAPDSADTPALRFLIPGNTSGAGVCVPLPGQGLNFSTGLGFRIVTGSADNDNTGVVAGDVMLNYGFI